MLDEAQDTALVGTLEGRVAERHIALDDELSMLGLTMDLAEAMTLPMSVVWAAIRNWIDQGAGVGHGDQRRTTARWAHGAVGAVRRGAGNLAKERRRARRRPLTVSGTAAIAMKACRAAVPRPAPDAAGAQRLAGVPPPAQRRRRDRLSDL